MPRELPQRHTIRWQGYDYASVGAYYLTIPLSGTSHARKAGFTCSGGSRMA